MGTPGGAHVIDEARQVGDAGCWRVDAFAVRVPQDPEQAAHLGQGAARGRGNGVEGGAGLVGTTLEHVGADAGLHGDHRHRVGDHVVQFLRNPQPFFGEHAASALALDIGTFLCLAHAHLGRLATRAHGDADRPHRAVGGEVAHQADRVEPWCVADPNHYERGVDGSEAGNSPSLGTPRGDRVCEEQDHDRQRSLGEVGNDVQEDPGAGDDHRQQRGASPDRQRGAGHACGDDRQRGGLGHALAEFLCEHRGDADDRGEHRDQRVHDQRVQRTQPLDLALEPPHRPNVANYPVEHIRLATDRRVIPEMYGARLITNHLQADEIGSRKSDGGVTPTHPFRGDPT
jgi:hypothetical protein